MARRNLMRNMSRNDLALTGALALVGFTILCAALLAFVPEFNWQTAGTVVTAIFTVVLAWSTIRLWRETQAIGSRTDRAFRTAERAYVKISHSPPGLRPVKGKDGTYVVDVVITNYGRTPATVTDALVRKCVLPKDEELPVDPDYTPDEGEHVPPKAFLVKDDSFYFTRRWVVKERIELPDPTHVLYAIGYVEYKDTFGRRYRSGYARRYKPERNYWDRDVYPTSESYHGRSNLIFVSEETYDYDICLDDEGSP